MSKTSSAKYYQENKERLQKKARERYRIFLKRKKKKSNNMVMNVTKISQKMKKIIWLSIEKKHFIIIIRKSLIYKILLLYKEKYKKHFSFVLMFEK